VKSLTILGATGSIGASTLALVAENPSAFSITALTAEQNVEDLARLALAHKAKFAVIADESKFLELKSLLSGSKTKALAGKQALEEAASFKTDLVISAITGIAGLKPTYAAIEAGNTVALANKESLVAAGALVMQRAKQKGVTILPVDSEHNALFQALYGYSLNDVDKLILTASGGPFRTWDKAKIDVASKKEALKHPNWNMGAKVTIDSASLMNKGLELIEAHFLFDCPAEKLEVIVHPQSVIHGLAAYKDGSFLAQMGASDMRIPISSCLNYPLRAKSSVEKLDFESSKIIVGGTSVMRLIS
jgi:1-deoxy-D-xylulose-5-phosphate reductoisomerase